MAQFLRSGMTTLALVAGAGFALAQQPAPAQEPAPPAAQQQSAPAPAQPGSNLQQPQAETQAEKATQSKSGQGGKEEPSSHAPSSKPMDTAVFVNGSLAVPGASTDTHTTPAKYSKRNAALDELPVVAPRPAS